MAEVQWVDRTPDPLAEGVADLLGGLTRDAPLGDMDDEPGSWDVARLRASEARSMARGRLRICTAVVHCSGAVAGHTDVALNEALGFEPVETWTEY